MKVLHVAAEIAGQPSLLCRGLRQLGVDARSLAFGETWHRYPSDITIDPNGLIYVAEMFGNRVQMFRRKPREDQ